MAAFPAGIADQSSVEAGAYVEFSCYWFKFQSQPEGFKIQIARICDMLVDDTSTDVDAVRDDLRFELIVLHGEVKKLDVSWDFTAIVNPLLADQGPALQVIPRINKQIERLKKVKEDFEQKTRICSGPPQL